jgi:hypothetical protein
VHAADHIDLPRARFRANPSYELVRHDHLPAPQQALIQDLTGDPEYFGILRPRDASAGGIKAVSRATAQLFATLKEPGALASDPEAPAIDPRALAVLVLDGALEMEHDGTFLSGAETGPLLLDPPDATEPSTTALRLSREAVRYAQDLRIDDPLSLSARMYFFNRVPLSPAWRRRLPTPSAVEQELGIGDAGQDRALLGPEWKRAGASRTSSESWVRWRRSGARRDRGDAVTYKLYVSPAPSHLRDGTRAALRVLARSGTTDFKVGGSVSMMLRPDKLVAYFDDDVARSDAVAALRRELDGMPAQGIPFTEDATGDGLISLGADPVPVPQVLWRANESWRLWVTNRLAIALLAARRARTHAMQPWAYALARIRFDGVNTTTWAMDSALGTRDSALGTRHSALGTRDSGLGTRHSAPPPNRVDTSQ